MVVQAGVRSLLAPWMGGATAPGVVPETAGVRSLLAFWCGGAFAGAAVQSREGVASGTNDPYSAADEQRAFYERRRRAIQRDESEILQLVAIIKDIFP